MKATLRLIILVSVIGLAGCAGAPTPAAHYILPTQAADQEAVSRTPERTLIVGPIQLASYLESQGIVLQRDDILLQQASSHLWAEDLDRQLHRGLRQRLDERLPDTRVLGNRNDAETLRLSVEVDRFQGRYDGMAVAAGRWQLYDASGELLALAPFSVSTALETDGYPALVRALGESWDRVADQIAERIMNLY